MVDKQVRGKYTLEYKLEAVRQVKAGQSGAVVAKVLGIPSSNVSNWVRLDAKGQLGGVVPSQKAPVVTAEQMELARLRAEVARLKMERDIAKKGRSVLCAGCAAKYAWVRQMSGKAWPVSLMCEVLEVSTSGYFNWKRGQDAPGHGPSRFQSDEALLAHMRAIHAEIKGEYGWPRMHKELLARGIRVGKERVRVLMQRHGIKARTKKKFVVTTDSKHHLPVAPDLVQRRFNPEAPNLLWSGDITYIPTDEGWLYLAAVLDLHSRQVVGWSMQPHMQTSLVKDALLMACWRRRPAKGLIFHSDRGSQYCSHEFQTTMKAWGISSSMSRKGNCWDNAPTESFWGHLKVACVLGQRFATREQARTAILNWMAFYNHSRLHSALGYLSPMQYEQRWLAAQRKNAA
ncbi:IS3 family transposase [Aquabacterium sp. G14]|uniref:IS3 family transposase n=1 Tax=Aquabacterium sp. G14 TaxID=3130164 RepID=UPI0030AFFC6B